MISRRLDFMALSNPDAYKRNYGFWSDAEQASLGQSKVSIGGVGGDGFQLGVKLAMMGVERFSAADPEEFEIENSNRVFGANSRTYGKNKAEVFRDTVLDIRPNATVEIYTEGVTRENVEEFMKDADLVLDESELTYPDVGTMIARQARKQQIPDLLVMNIGFAGIATSFHPQSKNTFEKMMGIPKDMPLEDIANMSVDLSRCLPYVPNYADFASLEAVQESLVAAQQNLVAAQEGLEAVPKGASLPSISPGVDIASALGSTEAFLHLTAGVNNKRRNPTWAPRFRYMDAYNGKSGVINFPRVSHYLGLAAMVSRSQMHLNPRASYRQDERDARS